MNSYTQEEFVPQKPVRISAKIIAADVVTNSLVLSVGEFSYKPFNEKLALVSNTVIKLDD